MTPIRVVIADDHAILRSGLKMLLATQKDIVVVGEAPDGAATVEAVERFQPDVVLLDISMPGLKSAEVTRRIIESHPRTKVLVLTMHDDVEYLQQLFESGARGYLVKNAADAELLTAIRAVHEGRRYVDPALAGEVASQLWTTSESHEPKEQVTPLSEREREVLEYIAKGCTNKETASLLHVSVKTVECYRMRLMRKLGLRTRADLVRFAAQIGILNSV
jgi:DNA-binding NarL/FixJ family response regulator